MWKDNEVNVQPDICMWEILVPTEKRQRPAPPNPADFNPMGDGPSYESAYERWKISCSYTTRYHRVWDEKVRAITGGLTIMQPAKGQWVSPSGELYQERMIPVRIVATRDQIEQIVDLTLTYYDQLAVLCYKVSDEVIMRHVCDKGCQYAKDVGMAPEHHCGNGCMYDKKEQA